MTARGKAEFALFATTFIWGSTFVVVKAGTENISPSLFITLRFGIGSVLLALFLLRQLASIQTRTIKKGMILGVMLGVGIVLQNYGIYETTASKSAFITGLMVIFTPIAQFVLERRLPKIGNFLGIVVVTIGLYFLTSPDGSSINRGDLLILISAVIFGVYIVYIDLFTKGENVLHLALVQISMTTLTAAMVLPFEDLQFNLKSELLISLLYMGTCATILTTFMQTRFQKDTTPTRAVIIFTLEPVIAAVLAYYVLNEVLGTTGILGAGLIIAGILISEFSDSIIGKLGFTSQTESE